MLQMKEIRTKRNKLVGKLDERASIFSIKDGGKLTLIEMPPQGLRIWHTSNDGVTEEILIPAPERASTA
jgi:hypothetical protein